jgi:hypothetical protein
MVGMARNGLDGMPDGRLMMLGAALCGAGYAVTLRASRKRVAVTGWGLVVLGLLVFAIGGAGLQ